MGTVVTIIKTTWVILLLLALCVPILASCTGTIPRIDGKIEINFETEENPAAGDQKGDAGDKKNPSE